MIHVLFVCLGNICRSPMAEAIFAQQVTHAGLDQKISWDSAGTANYHPGKKPDHRTLQVLTAHGIETAHRARQITDQDFERFELMLAMDQSNFNDLQRRAEALRREGYALKARIEKMGTYEPQQPVVRDVPDPYYGDLKDFEAVYQMLEPACAELLQQLQART
ncbi:MAG: low molecular weight phosphotyrosine protein phosphatase [Candidatus Sericytochromatia bacterium]|nr:low molecular weight phosphotyrosine protein phosphatase [Candidatus Sericytochromatia bacterium]